MESGRPQLRPCHHLLLLGLNVNLIYQVKVLPFSPWCVRRNVHLSIFSPSLVIVSQEVNRDGSRPTTQQAERSIQTVRKYSLRLKTRQTLKKKKDSLIKGSSPLSCL